MKTRTHFKQVLPRAASLVACIALLGLQSHTLAATMVPAMTVATGEEAGVAAAKPPHRRHTVLRAPVKPAPAPQSKPQAIAVVRR